MKMILTIAVALLFGTTCRSQSLEKERLKILESFSNRLFTSADKPEALIKNFMVLRDTTADSKSKVKGLVTYMRDSLTTIYQTNYAGGRIAFVPYKRLKLEDNYAAFTKAAHHNIFALVNKNRVVMYALFEGKKIQSIFTIQKGRNDLSYFVSF